MLKRIWWAIKVGLFPHLERRKVRAAIIENQRRRTQKMTRAESMLDTAIIDLTKAIQGEKNGSN